MQFGKLDYLPEPWQYQKGMSRFLFSTQKHTLTPLKIYLGVPRIPDKSWIGTVFPADTKVKNLFETYVDYFNAYELNASFYGINEGTFKRMAAKAEPHFKSVIKLPQSVTHYRRLTDYDEVLDRMLPLLENLGGSLGPVLAQLPENMGINRIDAIYTFIEQFPKDVDLAIELRNKQLVAPEQLEAIGERMAQFNRILTITDTPGHPEVLHTIISAEKCLIRFNGTGDKKIDENRLLNWFNFTTDYQRAGGKEFYLMVHQTDPLEAVENIRFFRSLINDSTLLVHPQKEIAKTGTLPF